MATQRTLGRQWRDENRDTGFPFAAGASRRNRNGVEVPPGAFVDACLYPFNAGPGLYLRRVAVALDTIEVAVADPGGGEVGAATFRSGAPPAVVTLRDARGRPVGVLVPDADRVAALASPGDGTYLFEPADTEFAAACCVPRPAGAGSLTVAADGDAAVSGVVRLVGGDGVRLAVVVEEVVGPDGRAQLATVVRVHADGDPLFRRRQCNDADDLPRAITAVRVLGPNGEDFTVPVDADGEFTIAAGTALAARPALRVEAGPGGVVVYQVNAAGGV